MTIKFACLLSSFCLCVALSVLTVIGQTERRSPSKLESQSPLVAQAQTLLSAGKIDAAIEALTALARLNANDAQINYLLGTGYYQKANFARAVDHLSLALKQLPQESKSYRQSMQMLGLAHYFQGHLKDAVLYLEQVTIWEPEGVEIAYVLGIAYIQTHNPDKARESFARMFNLPAGSASAHLINAQMMIRQQFEEFAEKELQKALALDPKLPQANFLLGELAIYRANIDLGVELLQKEIALNPAFGMAYYRLGEAYTRQLKWDESIAPLQKSIWLNPYFSGPYIVLGKVHLKKGDLASAESILRRALRMDANNFSGHHLLAQVLQQANRREEAKKEFELAEQLRTNSDKQ